MFKMHQQSYNDFSSQDTLAGQFDVWQPGVQNQTSNTSTVRTNNPVNNNSGSHWQVNRENAFDEAYRSVNNLSNSNTPGGNPNVRSSFSNPINQASASHHSFAQYNRMANLNMEQTQPATTQQYCNEQVSNYSAMPSLSTNPSLPTQTPSGLSSMQLNSLPLSSATSTPSTYFENFSQRENYGSSSMYTSNFHPSNSSQIYRNPLDDGDDASNESPEALLARMHENAAKQQMQARNSPNQPLLSKAALAQVTQDLDEAAAPFQTVETFKEFRNKQLGITKVPSSVANSSIDASLKSSLSVHAAEFVPRSKMSNVSEARDLPNNEKENEFESIQEVSAINLTDMYVNELVVNPACYDDTIDDFVRELIDYNLTISAVSVIVDKIYEMCVREQNFRYLGSQLCDKLSNCIPRLEGFRKALLNKAQKEFQEMDADEDARRARNFTQFMAELFLNLHVDNKGSRKRFLVLGRSAVFGVVRKMIDHPSDENLQCAVRVLKLTVTALEDSLKDDGKGSIEKLNSILDDLEAMQSDTKFNELTLNLLRSLARLRKDNWGRVSVSSSSESRLQPPDVLSEQDENYYMNEPVFFTPGGKLYTAADAANPEFFEKHLAPYSVSGDNPQGNVGGRVSAQNSSSTSYHRNPLNEPPPPPQEVPYPAWSSGDANRPDPLTEEDDYDADFEAFLRESGQRS